MHNEKLPKLKRIALDDCTMTNYDWPEVYQLAYRLQSKMTEVGFSYIHVSQGGKPRFAGYFSGIDLTNISALRLYNIHPMVVSDLNRNLTNGELPNLSELSISMYLHGNECDSEDEDVWI